MIQLTHLDEPTLRSQAISAGFVTVEFYIQNLVEQDADRLACERGSKICGQAGIAPLLTSIESFASK